MVPATSNCRKTRLKSLSGSHCLILASVLMTQNNPLRHLDLGFNSELRDSGVNGLCKGLQSPHCKLETLSLAYCGFSESAISILAEALMSNPFHLRDLNLHNTCTDKGVSALVPFLQSPHCRLHTLRLGGRFLTAVGCSALTTALMSNPSHLRVLRFDNSNQLRDSGVIALTPFLLSPECRLRTLSLHHCGLTSEEGCSALASALEVCSSLKELDLSINYLQESAVRALSRGLTSPRCRLDLLRMTDCNLSEDTGFSALASALQSNPSSLRELGLVSNYNLSDPGVTALSGFLQSPDCSLHTLSLHSCNMSGVGCSALASALTSNPCHLRSLDLEGNSLGDSGVNALSQYLQSPQCELQTLSLNSCGVSSAGVLVLVSALMSNPHHLRVLDLGHNRDLGDSGLQSVSQYLQRPDCGLQDLRLSGCGLSEESACSALASALEACSSLKKLDLSNNHLQESAVTALSHGLRNPGCRLETLSLNKCHLSLDSCSSLASALRSNPESALTKLDLGNNNLPHPVPDLTEVLEDPDSRLQKLITFTHVPWFCGTFIPPTEKSQQEEEESQDVEELPSEQDQDHPDVKESESA